jgi:hypothetical protein
MSGPQAFSDLFILSPSYMGTTAMAKLVLASPRVWSRMHNAEGQKLPEAKPLMPVNSWNAEASFDWPAIKAVWEEGRPEGSILLEKSPPNMAHAARILEVWPEAFFVISMRNPLAVIASYLRRKGADEEQVATSVSRWINRSQMQRQNVKRLKGCSMVTTYEAFVSAPAEFVTRLEAVFGPLGIDAAAPVQVKRYEPAPISDHNARQIATLSAAHRELAETLLQQHGGKEMAFWGY